MATIATRKNRWPVALAAVLVVYLTAAGLLFSVLPAKDGKTDWFAPLIPAAGWPGLSRPPCSF